MAFTQTRTTGGLCVGGDFNISSQYHCWKYSKQEYLILSKILPSWIFKVIHNIVTRYILVTKYARWKPGRRILLFSMYKRNQIGAVIPVFHRKLNWTCTSVCPYPTLILLCLLFAPPPLPRARLFLGFRKLERWLQKKRWLIDYSFCRYRKLVLWSPKRFSTAKTILVSALKSLLKVTSSSRRIQ